MSQQGPKSPHEEFIMPALAAFVLFGLGWVIWKTYHLELTSLVRWIRVCEMWIASIWVDKDYGVNYNGTFQLMKSWRSWLPKARPQDISTEDIAAMTVVALAPLRMVFSALLFAAALWIVFRGPNTQYRRIMGIERLMEEQAKTFPVITPFLKFSPIKIKPRAPGDPVPKRLPLFAEALSPEEWAAYHQIPFKAGKLDRNKAWQALGLQLGQRWRGPLKLPLHSQGLFAVFALKHVRKRKDSERLMGELAKAWSAEKGFNPTLKLKNEIRAIIKDPNIGGKLQPHADRHGYETTAMLRALQRARQEGGVLAPAEFLWLRGHDRTLWYPLNNLGRRAYHPEAAGALSHFVNELVADQKIPTPRFDDVIRIIEKWLSAPTALPIPPLEDK